MLTWLPLNSFLITECRINHNNRFTAPSTGILNLVAISQVSHADDFALENEGITEKRPSGKISGTKFSLLASRKPGNGNPGARDNPPVVQG